MQKEELLHLHMLLIHVKKYYESVEKKEIRTELYDSLSISPVHIHKNKICHKEAILTLGDELVHYLRSQALSPVEYSPVAASDEIVVEQ